MAICALLSGFSYGQTITKDMLPGLVKQLKSELPQKIDDSMIWTDCFLRNSNSEMVFTFKLDPSIYDVTPQEMIQGFDQMTPAEKKNYLGEEFNSIARIMPVPMFALIIFPNGQKYSIKLTD